MEKHKSHTKIDTKTREWVIRLHSEGLNPVQIEKITGVSKTSVRRILYPTAQWVLNDQQRTKKEPAPAATGQAHKENNNILHHTNNIAQSENVVKNFTDFLPILLEFARQYFGNVQVIQVIAHDYVDGEKLAKITFADGEGNKYCLLLEGGLA